MPLIYIVVGAALLLLGRRLFWLFVAGVGFVVGAFAATEWFGATAGGLTLLLALAAGIIGALLSIFLQRLMVAVAGFLAGGYLFCIVALVLQYESLMAIAFLLGGIIGALFVLAIFEWALVLLSSLMGATLIAQSLPLESAASALLFLVLAVLGVVVQAGQMSRPAPAIREGQP